jgi:hypothetical protein
VKRLALTERGRKQRWIGEIWRRVAHSGGWSGSDVIEVRLNSIRELWRGGEHEDE